MSTSKGYSDWVRSVALLAILLEDMVDVGVQEEVVVRVKVLKLKQDIVRNHWENI
jgi:hypothetical protein